MHYPQAFKAVANQAKRLAPQITHKQRVQRLYRKSLKLMICWAYERELVNQEAERIRSEFDACRNMSEAQASGVIRRTEDELARLTHPDPIVHGESLGGVGWVGVGVGWGSESQSAWAKGCVVVRPRAQA